jgi:hypothetical protein
MNDSVVNMVDDEDDEEEDIVNHIVTMDRMLDRGLSLLYTDSRQGRASKSTNLDRFLKSFGVDVVTACKLYEHLQRTTIDEARIIGCDRDLHFLLISLYFLRNYPTARQMESLFDYSPKYIAGMVWEFVKKIRSLKEEIIRFPSLDEVKDEEWLLSVDGTHVWIQEPSHEELAQDPKFFSKKMKHAGCTFELGICLTGGLIWINGPFPAGTNDITMFRKPGGLLEKLQEISKKAIGDRGYTGEPKFISYFNLEDSKGVKKFKTRALMRHEIFNGIIKVFRILSGHFLHSIDKLSIAFEAVCVICQFKLETDVPLFDILIQQVIDKEEGLDDDSDSNSSDEEDEDNEMA